MNRIDKRHLPATMALLERRAFTGKPKHGKTNFPVAGLPVNASPVNSGAGSPVIQNPVDPVNPVKSLKMINRCNPCNLALLKRIANHAPLGCSELSASGWLE